MLSFTFWGCKIRPLQVSGHTTYLKYMQVGGWLEFCDYIPLIELRPEDAFQANYKQQALYAHRAAQIVTYII